MTQTLAEVLSGSPVASSPKDDVVDIVNSFCEIVSKGKPIKYLFDRDRQDYHYWGMLVDGGRRREHICLGSFIEGKLISSGLISKDVHKKEVILQPTDAGLALYELLMGSKLVANGHLSGAAVREYGRTAT